MGSKSGAGVSSRGLEGGLPSPFKAAQLPCLQLAAPVRNAAPTFSSSEWCAWPGSLLWWVPNSGMKGCKQGRGRGKQRNERGARAAKG